MKTTRRKFIAGLATATVMASPAYGFDKANTPLVHHVFFWLKNPDSSDDLNKLIEGLSTLKSIKSLKKMKIGLPANTPKRDIIDDSYSVSLLTFFDDVKGHNDYQVHPVHLKFIENYSALWQKVLIYDSLDI